MAPFILENLGCTGSEKRLVDCPESSDVYVYTYALEIDFDYYVQRTRQCDLGFATFAYVACGTLSDQGPQFHI